MEQTTSNQEHTKTDIGEILFAPAGKKYTDEDGVRIFGQQPIDRIPRYLVPRKNLRFLPPLVHYGWILDKELTLKLALELSEPFYHWIDGPKKIDYWTTFTGLITRLMAHLGLPVDRRVSVCQIGTVELSTKARIVRRLGLSMGTNYTGHIPEESAKKLRDATAPGADVKWYLDTKRCKWVENCRWRDLAKEKQPKQFHSEGTQALPDSPHA
ncbi:uncharacterized protein STEHIDRAFT_158975 [Stereum hirsutum FP-91666 SS1]|uniref:uncharacterized protein n=1 Tax=Stereum hirsutum (strain FP-91666) TaxID=721885 RepID=UPI00044495E3|nr:uncharacterized protein STEHIDRAFT_158975 [Stereum hirsutum FP-91666 SS1]EIM84289.1 hypothetical protein STEHIDRAFT_158975 [Stereum hirsutum FP-91666 SS1]